MKWIPHNYQVTAKCWLLDNPYSGLFLDPGLGKTSITLSTINTLIGSGESIGVLLIAPLRVVYTTWPNEINKWENFNNITSTILHGKTKKTLWSKQVNLYLINPEGLSWLYKELLSGLQANKKLPFDTLWIDESTKFKNPTAKTRFKLIKDMLPLFKRRHIMTGTPAPKNLLDLWPQAYLIDEGKALTANFYKFRNKYFQADDWNKFSWHIKEGAQHDIHNNIAPIVLEMSAADYLDMPPLTNNYIPVTLTDKAYKYYNQMEKDFFIEMDNMEASAEQMAQASMKCHQIANGNVYEDIIEGKENERKIITVHNCKVEALKDLIEELNGKPLLVAYHYKHDLQALQAALGADLPFIGSGVTPKQTKALCGLWNAGKLPVLAGQPASMAHGLNMQGGGNDICWYSLTWNLEAYLQFNARIYRQGIKGNVRIHHLVASNTVDQVMVEVLKEKGKNQQALRNALKAYRLNKLN